MSIVVEDSRIGTMLNERYRIIKRIASGGMGIVYRGEHVELGKAVAIKFIQELFVSNERLLGRFQREAKAMSKLSHPYCVSVIDFGVDGLPYIVMEYVTGETLKDLLALEKFSVGRSLRVARQLLAAVGHAHSHGIVHRDIKPENIMVSRATGMGEHIRIFDFGLAKLLDASQQAYQSMTSVVIGTPHYMSPEQSRGSKVDERADLYSIGVVLFELLTGRKLFAQEEAFEVVRAHRETTPPSLNEVQPTKAFSKELETVIAKSLCKNPSDRYPTADSFLEALDATPEAQTENGEYAGEIDPQYLDPTLLQESVDTSEVLPQRAGAQKPRRILIVSSSRRLFGLVVFIMLILTGVAGWLAYTQFSAAQSAEQEQPTKTAKKKKRQAKSPPKTKAKTTGQRPAQANPPKSEARTAAEPPREKVEPTEQKPAPKGDTSRAAKTLDDVRVLIEQGRTQAAIDGLVRLRQKNPNSPYIVYLLGNQYYEKMWWSDALDMYQQAIRLNSGYRKRRPLIRNAINALNSNKTRRKARSLILNHIGKAALPQLRFNAKKGKSATIRKQAKSLANILSKKRKRKKKRR